MEFPLLAKGIKPSIWSHFGSRRLGIYKMSGPPRGPRRISRPCRMGQEPHNLPATRKWIQCMPWQLQTTCTHHPLGFLLIFHTRHPRLADN